MMPADTALVYLARGAEADHLERFDRFLRSYPRIESGIQHSLYVIFKGYADPGALSVARERFSAVKHAPLFLDDERFDIGAYAEAANLVTEDVVCFANSNTEIVADRWLAKLRTCLDLDDVGMVGASGSFESLGRSRKVFFQPAPNVHLRSNVFMMHRSLAAAILGSFSTRDKIAAFMAESGPDSITRQVIGRGLGIRVVGRDGRGFSPTFWPSSQCFRSGDQSNLLVEDNLSREFDMMPPSGRRESLRSTWGRYADPACLLRFP